MKVKLGKFLLATIGKILPLKRHPGGKIAVLATDGTVQTGFVANAWYAYDDKNERTNAGEYPVAVTLKEPANATWKGAAPTLKWEIKKQDVKKPVVTASFTFDNTEKVACVQPEADIGKYALSGEKGTNAGSYTVVARLNNAGAVNYKWQNGDEILVQ